MCVLYVCVFSTLALWSGPLVFLIFSQVRLRYVWGSLKADKTLALLFPVCFHRGHAKTTTAWAEECNSHPCSKPSSMHVFQPGHTSLWARIKYVLVVCGVLSLAIWNCWVDSNALCHHFEPCPIFFIKFAHAGPLSALISLDQPQLEPPATPTPMGPRSPISTQPRAIRLWLSSKGGVLLSYPCLWLHLFSLWP